MHRQPAGPQVALIAKKSLEVVMADKPTTLELNKPSSPKSGASELYVNRELSWLEFNARVLAQAARPELPLLEKLKFLSIFSSNLDEFFMVRVAGLLKMDQEGIRETESPDAGETREILEKIRQRSLELVRFQHEHLHKSILPALADQEIQIVAMKDLTEHQKQVAGEYFENHIYPVLTPLAFDPAHPFPFLANLSLYLLVLPEESDRSGSAPRMGFVEIPGILPRLVAVPTKSKHQKRFVLLENVIREKLPQLFFGLTSGTAHVIRVTRNLDYNLLENKVIDLLKSMQKEVRTRELQEVARLEVDKDLPEEVLAILKEKLGVDDGQVYQVPSPVHVPGLMGLYKLDREDLKDAPFNPRLPQSLAQESDIFSLISKKDLLVHHPFESFYAVTEFLAAAASDPQVLAIKLTLYRTAGDSPIINSLIEAAENGKQVTAIIELKARFDERKNITWARQLERAGVNVVFGFIGLKTHGKSTLVIRREKNKLKRYVHTATGNYNSATARLYTDLGYFTCRDEIGQDVSAIFNLITGFNVLTGEKSMKSAGLPVKLQKMALAPLNLKENILQLIEGEIKCTKKHGTGFIVAQMNGLVDREIIDGLYRASQAGVKIHLLVRGICCLRPGIPGVSDNITVRSIIDRFLEHSRIFYFQAAGKRRVYLGSCDWMPRNMQRRIEFLVPVEDEDLKTRLIDEILATRWADNTNAHEMQADGRYTRRQPTAGEEPVRSQARFIDLARAEGVKSIPYDIAIRQKVGKKGRPVATRQKKKK